MASRQKHAPLIASGGALVLDDLFAPSWFAALRHEGLSSRQNATEQRKNERDGAEWRSGNPARFLATGKAGPVQSEIYAELGLTKKLSRFTGRPVRQTGEEGSYSYYDRPGHFLGLHRDIKRCDVTLITCLEKVDGIRPSGALRVYPAAVRAGLNDVHAGHQGRDIQMAEGQSVLLLGGCIPHEVLPAEIGYRRAISVLCFEMT